MREPLSASNLPASHRLGHQRALVAGGRSRDSTLVLVLVALLLSLGCSFGEPEIAYALIRLNPPTLASASADAAAEQPHAATIDVFCRGQKGLVTDSVTLDRALAKPGIEALSLVQDQSEPSTWLETTLRVEFLGDRTVMRISLDGHGDHEAAMLVNAVAESYLAEADQAARAELSRKVKSLEKRQEKLREQIDRIRRAADVASRTSQDQLRQGAAEAQIADLQKSLNGLTAEIQSVHADLETPPATVIRKAGEDVGSIEKKVPPAASS